MTGSLVFDSEAFSALAGPSSDRRRDVRAALEVAWRLGRKVVVPALVLAELYRGRRRESAIDALLSREIGIVVRDTDRSFGRLVGAVLAAARAGSDLIVDAHVIAAAVEEGGGMVLTVDTTDLERLAAPYRNVQVVGLA